MAWSEGWAREERTMRMANSRRRSWKLVVMAVPLSLLFILEMYSGLGFALGLYASVAPAGVAIALGLALAGPASVLITYWALRRSGQTRVNKLILASGVGFAVSLLACFELVIWIGEASII